jgi:hypothetical protein
MLMTDHKPFNKCVLHGIYVCIIPSDDESYFLEIR